MAFSTFGQKIGSEFFLKNLPIKIGKVVAT